MVLRDCALFLESETSKTIDETLLPTNSMTQTWVSEQSPDIVVIMRKVLLAHQEEQLIHHYGNQKFWEAYWPKLYSPPFGSALILEQLHITIGIVDLSWPLML